MERVDVVGVEGVWACKDDDSTLLRIIMHIFVFVGGHNFTRRPWPRPIPTRDSFTRK